MAVLDLVQPSDIYFPPPFGRRKIKSYNHPPPSGRRMIKPQVELRPILPHFIVRTVYNYYLILTISLFFLRWIDLKFPFKLLT